MAVINKQAYLVGGTEFVVDARYQIDALAPLGKGAYGTVVGATDSLTGRRVAVKRLGDVFAHPVDAKRVLRELKLLRFFAGVDNLINILDVMVIPEDDRQSFNTLYVVTELLDTDLHQVIKSRQEFTMQHIQHFMLQILKGLRSIHAASVIHRDMKPSNVVLNADCTVKIVDFGLARPNTIDMHHQGFTEYVATRWYRAPEVIYESGVYSESVDVWAAGCIFAELLLRKPLFPGKDQVHQLSLILNVLGTPSREEIAAIRNENARNYVAGYPFRERRPFSVLFPGIPAEAVSLLEGMLQTQPSKRLTAAQCLEHAFFADVDPPPGPMPAIAQFTDFAFETEQLTVARIREHIWLEMALYHPDVFPNPVPQFDELAAEVDLPSAASAPMQ